MMIDGYNEKNKSRSNIIIAKIEMIMTSIILTTKRIYTKMPKSMILFKST